MGLIKGQNESVVQCLNKNWIMLLKENNFRKEYKFNISPFWK